jgi:hypothetical protein
MTAAMMTAIAAAMTTTIVFEMTVRAPRHPLSTPTKAIKTGTKTTTKTKNNDNTGVHRSNHKSKGKRVGFSDYDQFMAA